MTDQSSKFSNLAQAKVVPILDSGFRPAALVNKEYRSLVQGAEKAEHLAIGLERGDGSRSVYRTKVLPPDHPDAGINLPYVERLVKFLLWQKGGWKVTIGGSREIGEHIRAVYSSAGNRRFDSEFMGHAVYERSFQVEVTGYDSVAEPDERSNALGRHLEGYRIGFDLGASDRKVAAVVDGETVYSEEVVWSPRDETDPDYHYREIMQAMKSAASHMPRVDAIGGSSAGVIIESRPMVASLFRGVPQELFETRIKNIFIDIGKEWGVPIQVANDGDVTALAGSMSLDANSVLGIAMGSSEAVGYVNEEGNITGWLNELAFAPIDYNPSAPVDEWSGDRGCGAQYLTQQAVFRLAQSVGIDLKGYDTLAAKLKFVQSLLETGDERAKQVWETIGCYMGYAIAHYAEFYTIRHLLILGRVSSGIGGTIILDKANEVLSIEFPEIAEQLELHLPDEKTRRVGQAVAAASLPKIEQ